MLPRINKRRFQDKKQKPVLCRCIVKTKRSVPNRHEITCVVCLEVLVLLLLATQGGVSQVLFRIRSVVQHRGLLFM